MRWRTATFFLWSGAVVLVTWPFLHRFFAQSLQEGYSSQTVLVPFITAYLIWSGRKRIFSRTSSLIPTGVAIVVAGIVIYIGGSYLQANETSAMAARLTGVLLMLVGAFAGLFGTAALRAAIFPLCLLLLMMPLPPSVIDKIIGFLQWQSATLSYHLFSLLGVPVYRDGIMLTVPGVTIEVAKECSGINSSVALLLTALLVAWQTLRSTSRRIFLVLLTVPVSILKNAVRIVTLTLLALYVDPSFLTGKLHHQGGFVFFLIALGVVYPIWVILQKTEHAKPPAELPAEPLALPGLPR